MHVLKAFGRWISFFIFHMAIIFLITTVSMVILLGNRDSMKAVLNDSGVYEDFVDSVITTAAKESTDEQNSLPFDDSEFRRIANKNFDSKVLQSAGNHIIDGVYDWAEGSSEDLFFEINFQPQVNNFIEDLSNYAVEKYETLPPCTPIDNVNTTVFNISCQPIGSSREIIKTVSIEDLKQQDFLNEPILSDKDIFSTPEEKEDLAFIPKAYQATRLLPYISIAVIIVSGLVFVLLHRSKRRGIKRIGRDMITTAIFIALLTIVFGFILPRYTDTFSVQGEGLPRLFNKIIDVFLQSLDIVVINIAIVLGSVGISILAIEKMSRPESIYAEVAKKSGLTSSTPKKSKSTKPSKSKKPPVQTSEEKKKTKTKRKSKKYRKINL